MSKKTLKSPLDSFIQLSDDDLISMIQMGNEEAFRLLLTRYQTFGRTVVGEYLKNYPYDGLSFDELMSVVIAETYVAAKKYLPSKGNFYKYWRLVVRHGLNDYARTNSYQFGAKMFSGPSLDQEISEDFKLSDVIGQNDDSESLNSSDAEFIKFLENHRNKLGKHDLDIVNLLKEGFDVKGIAKKLKISEKTVYYRLSVLKKMASMYLSR